MSFLQDAISEARMNESLSDNAIKISLILRKNNFPDEFVDKAIEALDKLPDIFSDYTLDYLNGHVSGMLADERPKTVDLFFSMFCKEFGLSNEEREAFIKVLE